MSEFKYEIKEQFGKLGEGMRGDSIEFNLVSFNGREAKYDIRPWYIDDMGEKKMGKGISLKLEEVKKLKEILNTLEI